MRDPTHRFSGRVEHYLRSRPSYPGELVQILSAEGQLDPSDVVADVGSGTGKLGERFLLNGNRVIGIEPNREMRDAGDRLLRHYEGFRSVDGRAEDTGLPDRSVDVIVAGQSFHWFELDATRKEFSRILRPGGRAVLVWNLRRGEASPWMAAYEEFVRSFATDYDQVKSRYPDDRAVGEFFRPGRAALRVLGNRQRLDLEGLRSRVLSSSFMPSGGEPGSEAMLAELGRLFAEHQVGGQVTFEYETKVYFGLLDEGSGDRPSDAPGSA